MDILDKVLLSPKSLKENGFQQSEATLRVVRGLLMTAKNQRNTKQVNVLQALTKNIKFFLQKNLEFGFSIHLECCQVMTYEMFNKDTNVFEFGQQGDKFFIIVEGLVQVIVPIPVQEETKMLPVAQLSTGMAFGELALLKDQPRAATILCLTDCHFAVIGKSDYMKIIGKAESKILDKQIDFLKEIPYFSKWSKRKLEKLNLYFSHKKFNRKQVVFANNTPADFVYIVKSGEFELAKPFLLGKNKNFMVKVALLTKGEMFGEAEVMSKGDYMTTCTCYSTTGELLCVSAENFLLKFCSNSEPNDEIDRKIKYKIRESRLEGLKNFFDSPKPNDNSLTKTTAIPRLKVFPKKWESSKGVKKFSPLNCKQLEHVKNRALGTSLRTKIYLGISTPYETVETEEIDNSFHSNESIFHSFHEMSSHQPGGYYRGRLKKPIKPKQLSLDNKTLNRSQQI